MVLIMIFLFCLPRFAIGGENSAVQPPLKLNQWFVFASPSSKDKKVYQEFSSAMTNHYNKLDQLFKSNTEKNQNSKNEWQTICHAMRADIQKARLLVANMPKDSDARIEGAEWFRTLMSIVVNLESEGLKTFQSKVKLDKLIVKKKKSLKEQNIHKKNYQKRISHLDELIVFGIDCEKDNNHMKCLKNFKPRNNDNKDYMLALGSACIFATNAGMAVKEYQKDISKLVKKDDPLLFDEEEEYLTACEIKGNNFKNFNNLLLEWKVFYLKRYSEYKKIYHHWYSSHSWIFTDALFKDTKSMKGQKLDKIASECDSVYINLKRKIDNLEDYQFVFPGQMVYPTK